jgi:hypothetical protein
VEDGKRDIFMMKFVIRSGLASALLVSSLASGVAQPTGAKPEEAASPQQVFDEFVGGTLTNCFFKYGPTGRDPLNNRGFPGADAVYWAAGFVRPPGSKVEMEGIYPNSRFMSFTSYDKAGQVVDADVDYMIDPDSGSVNLFRTGAPRTATPEAQRKYTVEIRLAEKPADLALAPEAGQPPRNTLYSLPSKNAWLDKNGAPVETILYRVYVPDRGLDYAGGEPVPSVKLTLADGSVLRGHDACEALSSNPKAPEETFAPNLAALVMPLAHWKELSHRKGVPATFPARYPADWRGAYDSDDSRDRFALKPLDYSDPKIPTPSKLAGSDYPNVFNTSLRSFINRELGKVVVIRLKPWKTVKTYDRGQYFANAGTEMRFWSIDLSESPATTRVVDGVFDEEFPVNSDGSVTFVASSEQDRPRFATKACGVGWANWKSRGDGAGNPNFGWLSIRNMLPDPETTDSFFALKRPGDERQVLGEHYPELKYYNDAAAFDALGCGGAASKAAMQDIPNKGAPNAVGWPYAAKGAK